ncbi:MAG: hypothetical protein JO256_01950, partial [Alphaproteobacteria bacterium]|nr:hypothetical protein [Alphaproteobacteria bacterium]
AIPEFNRAGVDYPWVKFHDGSQTTADSWLVRQFGSGANFPYGSDRVGYGIAYAIVTVRVNAELFSGPPQIVFVLDGVKLYDPRLDSSVGGSGSQRFASPSTWAFTRNPKVIEYNILRGITYGGAWAYGLQSLSAGRLPLASWFAAMNECDALVDKNGGGTEAQFRCGGEISFDKQPADVLAAINRACNGELAETGGLYETRCGAAGSATLSFSDDDIIITKPQSLDQFPGLDSLINAVTGRYPEPTAAWAMTDAPALYDADLESADGDRRLTANLDFELVPYLEQVERLMKASRDDARRFRTHTLVLPPECWGAVAPLTFVAWTSAREGYSAKLFKVTACTDSRDLDQIVTLKEVDPADYDWTPADDFKPKTVGPLTIAYPAAQAMSGFAVSAITITGADGRAKAGIRLSWTTSGIDDVDGVQFQVAAQSDHSAINLAGETDHFSAGQLDISENILSATAYSVRAKYRPISARDTSWSSWLDVTTDDVRLAAPDFADFTIDLSRLASPVQVLVNKINPVEALGYDSQALIRDLQVRVEQDAESILRLTALTNDQALRLGATIAYQANTITTRFTALVEAEASARRDLAAIVGGFSDGFGETVPVLAARVTTLESTTASLATGKADASSLATLDSEINTPTTGIAARLTNAESAIALLDGTSTATISQTAAAVRGQGLDIDKIGETLQTILAHVNDNAKRIAATVAFVMTTITATVTDGQSAMAKSQADLGAMLQTADATLSATITTVNQASVDRDAALTSSIATYASYFGDGIDGTNTVASKISTEASTRSAADTTLTNSVNTLTSWFGAGIDAVNTVAAKLSTEASTRASADTALASRATNLESVLTGFTTDGSVGAAISGEASTRAAADSANASDITTIYSYFGAGIDGSHTVASKISAEASARASADTAMASDISTIYSYFGTGINGTNTVVAAIASEASTRASADSALSSRTSTLEAALNSYTGINAVATAFSTVNAAVSAKSTVFVSSTTPTASAAGDLWIDTGNGNAAKTWNGSSWVARPDLNKATTFAQNSAPVAGAIGDIWINTASGANTMSRWNGSAWAAVDNATIAATASSLSTLSTTVSDHTTTLASYGTSIAGLQAEWGVQINTDNRVTGLVRLDGGATNSNFVVVANNFYYYDPTAGETPLFAISGGTAYLNCPLVAGLITADTVFANNIISHGKLVSGAGSQSYQAFGSGSKSSPTVTASNAATWTDVASVTVTGKGGTSAVVGSFTVKKHSGSFSSAYWRINISGGAAPLVSAVEFDSTPSTASVIMATGKEDSLGDGTSRTYVLQVSGDNSTGSFDVYNAQLLATVSR